MSTEHAGGKIKIIGVHPIQASEPCHLVEIELLVSPKEFDFASITQPVNGQPQENWQVAYDDQQIKGSVSGNRWVFFFHYLDLGSPLQTEFGDLVLPVESPLPEHLSEIEYFEP